MALVTCQYCGKIVPSLEEICLNCGRSNFWESNLPKNQVERNAFRYILTGNLKELSRLVKDGININVVADSDTIKMDNLDPPVISTGDSLLHVAIALKNDDAINFLLNNDIDINIVSSGKSSPLFTAIYFNNFEVAKYLIKNGANLHITNEKYGQGLLHYCTDIETAQLLIDHGVNPNARCQHLGYSPLHLEAGRNVNIEMIRLLLLNGADVNIKGNKGETPTHILCGFFLYCKKIEKVGSLLIKYGAGVDTQDFDGDTPLHWAVGKGRKINFENWGSVEAINFLIDNGCSPSITNNNGETPLDIATNTGKLEFVKAFEAKGISPKKRTWFGNWFN